MKRRPQINTRDPPKIRSSSIKGFNGVRSYPQTIDVIREKRVKFTDLEIDCPPNVRPPNESSVQYESIEAPGSSNAPKTSEYAFFKKLKKDAGCCHSDRSQKEDNQLKNFERSGRTREITNMFKDSSDNLRSSVLDEKARPNAHNLFLLPRVNESRNSGETNAVENNQKDIRSPLFGEKFKPINDNVNLSPVDGRLKNSGTEHLYEEIFSGKRKKLRLLVAETSVPEVEEICSKGCDLVSMLLNRLFPDSDENNCCRVVKSTQMRADTKCCLHTFPESDTFDKEFHWTQGRDFMEPELGEYLDDFCNKSREIIPSKWETKGSNSWSTSYAAKNHFQYENKNFDSDYEGGTANLVTVHDPYFRSDYENYGSTASIHIKKLKEFHDLDESATGKGPCTLLLDWELDNLKVEGDLSFATCSTEMESHSILAAPWDGHQESLDNGFDAGDLHSSSLFSSYPSKFSSLLHPHSANLRNQNVERFLDQDKLLVAELIDNLKVQRDLSFTTCSTEMESHSILAAPWDGHQESLDTGFDAGDLYSSSLFSSYPSKFSSLLHPHSANLCDQDVERFLDEDQLLVAELKSLPLSLSCTPKYLNLKEDYNTYNLRESSSLVSPQNHHWVMSKVSTEKHHPDLKALISSGLGFDLGWKCLSMSGFFGELLSSTFNDGLQSPQKKGPCSYLLTEEEREDCFYSLNHGQTMTQFAKETLGSHEWPSINFHIPLDKEMVRPLLLDSSSWHKSEEDIHYNDEERI